MNLNEWAIKWRVPFAAVEDLRREFGRIPTDPPQGDPVAGSEAAIQQLVRLEASAKGMRLWRNNVGATLDGKGNFIRYGLANDTKAMNAMIKSSDLIGVRPIDVGDGRIIGQFVAREIKEAGWRYTGTDREKAQLRFLELVASFGGDAAFATTNDTL